MDARRAADRALEQARSALRSGHLQHAADHLAGALTHAPTLPEAHELLSRLAAHADGGLHLFPLIEHAPAGRLAARAHLLAADGRPEDGLPLLAAASGHTPGADWAGVPWVGEPGLALRIEPDVLVHVLMRLCTAVGDPAPPPAAHTLRPYLTVARHAIDAHPDHAMLLGSASALARRLGETALAIDWATRGARARPTKLAEIWLGYAHRSAGHLPEALAALRRAVMHDPDDLSVYADIAGTLADNGRLQDALNWVERALDRDPEYDCAVHTAHRLRHRADGDLAHLVRLADFVRDHPDDSHEHTDLADCCRDIPWLAGVPRTFFEAPGPARLDAAGRADLARGYRPDAAGPADPARSAGLDAAGPADPARSSRPDAADPADPDTAGPVRMPSDDATRRLRRVATLSWEHPPAAYDAALPLIMVSPADLLTLVANPPADVAAAEVWACLGLLHHGIEEPWLDSTRRRLLLGLIDGNPADRNPSERNPSERNAFGRHPSNGSPDRITDAALFALIVSSWVDPDARADVASLVAGRLTEIATRSDTRPAARSAAARSAAARSAAAALLARGRLAAAQLATATPDLDPAARQLAARQTAASQAAAGQPGASQPGAGQPGAIQAATARLAAGRLIPGPLAAMMTGNATPIPRQRSRNRLLLRWRRH